MLFKIKNTKLALREGDLAWRGLLQLFRTCTTHHLLVEGFVWCSNPCGNLKERVSVVEKFHSVEMHTSLTLQSQPRVKHVAVRHSHFGWTAVFMSKLLDTDVLIHFTSSMANNWWKPFHHILDTSLAHIHSVKAGECWNISLGWPARRLFKEESVCQ